MSDDEIGAASMEQLAMCDPVASDPPPARESVRYTTILEKAMTTTTVDVPVARPQKLHHHRTLLAGAAAILLVAGGFIVLRPVGAPPARAEVQAAAGRLGGADSFRGEVIRYAEDGRVEDRVPAVIDGDRMVIDGGEADYTIVGDTVYIERDGVVTTEVLPPAERNAPYAESSAAVVSAALDGGTVEALGAGVVRGRSTNRYRIVLDDTSRAALSSLPASQLAWFDLEYPGDVTVIEVDVSSDLIVRIDVQSGDGSRVATEFYDFDAPDISIEIPTSGAG